MRLLHTSDWHLGQSLHQFERTYEHDRFLDWLAGTIESEQPDALLLCGDVFDNANPSSAAQRQLYRFLSAARARAPWLQVVLIGGNHDSPGRLEAPSPLFDAFGITVVGHVTRADDGRIDLDRLLVPLPDRAGRIRAWCLAVPYLRPGDVPAGDADTGYAGGVARLYRELLERALARRESGQAIIALGHCHMHGGAVSEESERRIVIGGAEALSADLFDMRLAYTALGHLHRAQTIAGRWNVRYSGSPLPMSFTEIDYPHQVVRIDLDGEKAAAIEPLRIPRAVDLLRIPPQPEPAASVLDTLAHLDLPQLPTEAQPYLEVRVRLDAPEPGLRARIEAALADKPVRLAKIETTYPGTGALGAETPALSLNDLGRLEPVTIFRRLYARQYDAEPPEPLLHAFGELLEGRADESAP
ncbi:exonuclease SbcCD subunit D [Methylotetracoccus oryzae]|uniref:exonuclease SbcCD subunit D n=1 Tax=Methylotetracoccus oryzae TaxID=1919059 RepID=UPI00111801D2|nr:exonuclease SbcCD subunit D C-terminal domain-containing protein [Methylotetracoccus oryzae]